jgi:uncharacterized repeat protein (TIGR01451 family)
MRCPVFVRDLAAKLSCFAVGLIVFLSSALVAYPQAGTSQVEQIEFNSIIIAMDNQRQGDTDGAGGCTGPDFNLRAYGLAVRLLHANVPLKWAIKNKATKDEADFSADVTQLVGNIGGGINVGGQDCTTETVNTPFAGGPIIIPAQYRAAALQVIQNFNALSDANEDVRVYNVNTNFVAPIRYTLTHKPFVAVGPDGGGFGSNVYTALLNSAGLLQNTHYGFVENNVFQTNACVTLAAQAHASDDAINYIGTYRSFAESGGNLLLQCKSVNVFENAPIPNGRFQTTLGWTTFGDSGGEVNEIVNTFPNPAMAFNQFVGNLADGRGNVSEYQLAASSVFQNGTLIAARNNSTGNTNKYVATVSRIGNSLAGGNVFELAGHNYSGSDSQVSGSALERTNGNRMALNTLLIPAVRTGCNLSINSVQAFKSVEMSNDINGNTVPNFGDTVEWTIRYINDGVGTITNFQITDSLDTLPTAPPGTNRLAYVPLSITVAATGASTSASANMGYNPNTVLTMLAPGAQLAPGGMITVKIKTVVQGFGTILNQASGTGTGISSAVLTDTTDTTTSGTVSGYPVACPGNCLPQNLYSAPGTNQDPTGIDLGAIPTAAAADVGGTVSDYTGRGISRELVMLQNGSTGEVKYATTNTFGRFLFKDVAVGEFYLVSVVSKRYTYQTPSFNFDLVDNVTDIVFTAQAPPWVGGGRLPGTGEKTIASPQQKPATAERARSVTSRKNND